VPCCSCGTGHDSGTAKARHHPAGDEAGGRHREWTSWSQREVDLSASRHGTAATTENCRRQMD